MSTDNARTTTEDPDYDYGALIGDTDIDEHALLEFDPDAVDPDHMQAAQAHEKVTTVAVATPGAAAQRRLAHCRGPRDQER